MSHNMATLWAPSQSQLLLYIKYHLITSMFDFLHSGM